MTEVFRNISPTNSSKQIKNLNFQNYTFKLNIDRWLSPDYGKPKFTKIPFLTFKKIFYWIILNLLVQALKNVTTQNFFFSGGTKRILALSIIIEFLEL
jgi:hypothetical protein